MKTKTNESKLKWTYTALLAMGIVMTVGCGSAASMKSKKPGDATSSGSAPVTSGTPEASSCGKNLDVCVFQYAENPLRLAWSVPANQNISYLIQVCSDTCLTAFNVDCTSGTCTDRRDNRSPIQISNQGATKIISFTHPQYLTIGSGSYLTIQGYDANSGGRIMRAAQVK